MIIKVHKVYSEGIVTNDQALEIHGNQIISIRPLLITESPEFDSVAPGLVDTHINGGEKFHFTADPTPETLADIEDSALKNGTVYTLPTLITSSFENMKKGIEAFKTYKTLKPNTGILGLHLEGPFLSAAKRGAHLLKYIQEPTEELLKDLINMAGSEVAMLTLAPEFFTKSLFDLILKSPINISLGHSNCSFEQAQNAFDQGITLVTHLYNAMSALGHRSPGLVGAALANSVVYTPIILDHEHVHAGAALAAYKAKGQKLFLISDSLFQNYTKNSFKWEEFDAVLEGKKYINSEGNLAGASISLADTVINATEIFNISLAEAINMATLLPALAIKTKRKIGKIAPDYESGLISFEGDFENIKTFNFD